MKKILKKLLPKKLFSAYHFILAIVASVIYGFPSKKMIVIGVTGTKGKTSTINFIWSCLSAGGYKTGIISTANIRIGEKEVLNRYHMTMPGRFVIQGLMAKMVKDGCKFCIVETTSQGILQHRNVGIYYDVAIFTNLTPEHLESHGGSFENYKMTKGKLFESLSKHNKILDGEKVKKIIISNSDSEHSEYFLNHVADTKVSYGITKDADCVARDIIETSSGVIFHMDGKKYEIEILGKFNVYNALPAIITAKIFGVSDQDIAKGLMGLKIIPGRMEKISEGQNFTLIVDYAHEKQSITNVLNTARKMAGTTSKVIILLGAEGGGRDKAKRPIMGELSAKMADYVVVSNVDPYDDEPVQILEDVATVAEKFGKVRNQNLFVIQDRRSGINKSISLAQKGDIVLITGKGAEQSMIIGNKTIAWDDRVVVREELRKIQKGL